MQMWNFETRNFRVVARIESDDDFDSSWCDAEALEKIESGEWQVFQTIVTVYFRGAEVGADSLCGSVYADPAEFFTSHRDPDPMNRNCSVMRAARGNVAIGHYFPDMVRQAIREARKNLSDIPRLRVGV